MAHISSFACGTVLVERKKSPGAISLMQGPPKTLEQLLSAVARHACDGKTFLVPGVPEAENDDDRFEALRAFQARLNDRVTSRKRRSGADA